MELKKSFDTRFSPEDTWAGLSDIHLVASCLPGASITEEIKADEYKGMLSVKVGPLAANFAGLISIARDEAAKVATVTGKGADAKSSSRVSATMRYTVAPGAQGGSNVEIVSDISLAGALAQFGKAAVMQEIANRMTNEFVRQFEARMAQRLGEEGAGEVEAAAPQSLDAGKLLWGVAKDRVSGMFRKKDEQ